MRIEVSTEIDAPAPAIWQTLMDVERWPEWTASMTRVQRLEPAPLSIGSRTRIEQPGMPPLVWSVTELDPERSFTWEARSAGLLTVAEHEIATRDGARGCVVTLRVRQTGALAPLVGFLFGRKSRRFVATEASGLKRRCEAQAG